MPMRIVRTYQQTFSGAAGAQWYFKFNRLYKQDPKNKFVVKCITLNTFDLEQQEEPTMFFMKCSSFASANSNVSSLSTDLNPPADYPQLNTNDWYLGSIGGGNAVVEPLTQRGDVFNTYHPVIMVDDLPLDTILVYWRTITQGFDITMGTGDFAGLFFALTIDEVSMDY